MPTDDATVISGEDDMGGGRLDQRFVAMARSLSVSTRRLFRALLGPTAASNLIRSARGDVDQVAVSALHQAHHG